MLLLDNCLLDIVIIEISVAVYAEDKLWYFFYICPLWNGLMFWKNIPNLIAVPTVLKISLVSERDESNKLE